MAEKNTRSILESIKNKLSKIDQKSGANSDVDIASEFDYVATHAKPQTPQNNNPEPVVNDKPEIINQTPALEKPIENDINSSAEFGEDDIEDYEHQIDFAAKPKAEEVDDLDMNTPKNNDYLNLDEVVQNPELSAPKMDEELIFDENEAGATLPKIEEFNLPEIKEEDDFLNPKIPQPIAEETLQPMQKESLENAKENHEESLEDEVEEDLEEEDEEPLEEEPEEEDEEPLEEEAEEELEEEHEEIVDDLQHPHEDEIKNVENVNAKKTDQYEAELEQLEHELEEQAKKQHKHPEPANEDSQAHDIELELEKDMMNFNPQNSDLNKFAAPAKVEQIFKAQEIQTSISQKSDSQILSEKTIEQSRDAINQLFQAKEILPEINSLNDVKLREIAIEILSPKLDKWLNNNLPKLVEDIVRHEIKKIIPK